MNPNIGFLARTLGEIVVQSVGCGENIFDNVLSHN